MSTYLWPRLPNRFAGQDEAKEILFSGCGGNGRLPTGASTGRYGISSKGSGSSGAIAYGFAWSCSKGTSLCTPMQIPP